MEYEELQAFATVLLAAAGAFILLVNCFKSLKELKQPADDLRADVEKHGELLERDNLRIRHMEEESRMQSRCILQLMNHQIDGNHVEQLIKARDDMQEFLIEK